MFRDMEKSDLAPCAADRNGRRYADGNKIKDMLHNDLCHGTSHGSQ